VPNPYPIRTLIIASCHTNCSGSATGWASRAPLGSADPSGHRDDCHSVKTVVDDASVCDHPAGDERHDHQRDHDRLFRQMRDGSEEQGDERHEDCPGDGQDGGAGTDGGTARGEVRVHMWI